MALKWSLCDRVYTCIRGIYLSLILRSFLHSTHVYDFLERIWLMLLSVFDIIARVLASFSFGWKMLKINIWWILKTLALKTLQKTFFPCSQRWNFLFISVLFNIIFFRQEGLEDNRRFFVLISSIFSSNFFFANLKRFGVLF